MSVPSIKAINLGKKYTIGSSEPYVSLRDAIADLGKKQKSGDKNTIWALKDVNFEIPKGEAVGVIGRNGAGKSTLLKLISRITPPTTGTIKISGRVASLLEVGTGFHPELTGKENIYLNGAILGMKRAEINAKFDEIVEFAEISRFIDTPVKRYSSGMYMRLAFAVAAHLETEILIVDEVLAVGDAQFQKKCLGKMSEISQKTDKTVLLVSHNMGAITSLCRNTIYIENGKVVDIGESSKVVSNYIANSYKIARSTALSERKDRKGSGKVRFEKLSVTDASNKNVGLISSGTDVDFAIVCKNKTDQTLTNLIISLDIYDDRGMRVLMFRTNFKNSNFQINPGEKKTIICHVPKIPLAPSVYRVALFLSHSEAEILDYVEDAYTFEVQEGQIFGNSNQGMPVHCKILLDHNWST